MKIFIQLNNTKIIGYGSTRSSEDDIQLELPDDHELFRNPFVYTYVNGQLIKDDSFLLIKEKDKKIAEMNAECNNTILSGFDYAIDGVEYHFSSSMTAQLNFQGVDSLFKDDLVPNGIVEWTVTDKVTGKIVRILINKDTFNQLKLQLFLHINNNISKFRNTLQPKIEVASTVAQVQEITW